MNSLDELSKLIAHFQAEQAAMLPGINLEEDSEALTIEEIKRPMLVRAVFARIEALIFNLKQLALDHDRRTHTLDDSERSICTEKTFTPKDNGDIHEGVHKTKLIANIRFAFKVATKAVGFSYELDVRKPGWEQLQRAVKVRDRLTHPKCVAHLAVSDDDLLLVMAAERYIDWAFVAWMAGSTATVIAEANRLEREWAEDHPTPIVIDSALSGKLGPGDEPAGDTT